MLGSSRIQGILSLLFQLVETLVILLNIILILLFHCLKKAQLVINRVQNVIVILDRSGIFLDNNANSIVIKFFKIVLGGFYHF